MHKTILGLATAFFVAACSGTGPQAPSGSATAVAPATASTGTPTATATAGAKLPKGFRRVTQNGEEYICQRTPSTVSRTEIIETCLTTAEFQERMKKGQDFLQGLQDTTVPGAPPGIGGKAFTPGF